MEMTSGGLGCRWVEFDVEELNSREKDDVDVEGEVVDRVTSRVDAEDGTV